VNLDGRAAPLAPRLVPLEKEIREFKLAHWRVVKTEDYGIVPWDWKVFQDNGDCYHHIGIHRDTFQKDYPGLTAWDSPNNGHYTLIWCRAGENNIVIGDDGKPIIKTTFKPLAGLTDVVATPVALRRTARARSRTSRAGGRRALAAAPRARLSPRRRCPRPGTRCRRRRAA
jgi:hypothetical protein